MPNGILLDCDAQIAERTFTWLKAPLTMKYDRALGLVNPNGDLIGSVILHGWNGSNLELSYFGENTLSPGIIKCIARLVICTFDPARVTVVVSKRRKRLMRSLQRFGFKLEGNQRCYYGKRDCTRNTGIRFVLFRDRIDQLAKVPSVKQVALA